MPQPISSVCEEALVTCLIENNVVRLMSGELEPAEYREVDDVLRRLRGRWDKSVEGHVFPYNPTEAIGRVLASGERPASNPTDFFPTPPHLVEQLIDFSYLAPSWVKPPPYRICEPSAGTGHIADAIRADLAKEHGPLASQFVLDVIENDPINVEILRSKGYDPIDLDFLTWKPDYLYHRILMNPPFSLPGYPVAYQDHVRHAYDLMDSDGILSAVIPNIEKTRGLRAVKDFYDWVRSIGDIHVNERRSFASVGTAVDTCTICLM